MTTSYFIALIALVMAGALGAFIFSARPPVTRLIARTGTMPPPMIGAVSILFGLFIGFSSAEITQRRSSLRLSTQREVSAARSILNFTTGVGPQAYPVREALVEYLQVVTTTEHEWLRSGAPGEPPGAGPVYSLNLITTGFAQQPGVSDVLKSALLTRVDDLTSARTDRLTLSGGAGSIAQWVGLAALAIVTQLVGAMAVAGQRGGGAIFLAGYTLTAVVGLVYLGWADGLIGPSRSQEQSAPFEVLLAQAPRLTTTGDDTLARMRDTGRVVIGARTDQFPFACVNQNGEQVGYTIGLCRSIVKRVRAAAGFGPIQVNTLALSPANRVAMIGSDVLIRTLVASSSHPEDYTTLDKGLAARAYGVMVRRGNTAFRMAANRALRDVIRTGEFERTYERWFLSALAPGGLNLRLPMSTDLRQELDAVSR